MNGFASLNQLQTLPFKLNLEEPVSIPDAPTGDETYGGGTRSITL